MSYPTFYLRGMRKIDDKFGKMITIRDACYAAGILDLPKEVDDYFNGDPDEGEQEQLIRKFGIDIIAIDGGSGNVMDHATNRDLLVDHKIKGPDDECIYLIDLKKLPTELETLRIEVTW